MKKITLFLLLIFVCSLVYAGDDILYTDERPNGRFWRQLNTSEKICFVMGIWTGIDAFFGEGELFNADDVKVSNTDTRINTEEKVKNFKETFSLVNDTFVLRKYYCLPKLTNDEIVGKIDKFYEDEFNRNIPIYEAYTFICAEYAIPLLEGAGYTVIPEEELRKKYSQ